MARPFLRQRGADNTVTVEELVTLSPSSGIELPHAQRAVTELTGKRDATAAHQVDLDTE